MDSSQSEAASTGEAPHSRRRLGVMLAFSVVVIGIAVAAAYSLYQRADAVPLAILVDEFRVGLNAPFITTADVTVDKMVERAELSKDDVVYDLGCGDGRLVITAALKHGCHGVGIDIDPERVAEARANVTLHGVDHLIEIREQDIFTVDLSETDVVLMYLLPWMTKRLVPQFQEMKPGSRIISHDFGIGDIKYIKPESTVEVPLDKTHDTDLVHRWYVPLTVPPPRTEQDE